LQLAALLHFIAQPPPLGCVVPDAPSKHAFFGTDAAIPDKYKERKIEI
jgi:hypothetical protein